MPLTPADVHNVAFSKPPIGKRGYNEDEVDAFLDLVEAELARLIEENDDLREQVAAARAATRERAGRPGGRPLAATGHGRSAHPADPAPGRAPMRQHGAAARDVRAAAGPGRAQRDQRRPARSGRQGAEHGPGDGRAAHLRGQVRGRHHAVRRAQQVGAAAVGGPDQVRRPGQRRPSPRRDHAQRRPHPGRDPRAAVPGQGGQAGRRRRAPADRDHRVDHHGTRPCSRRRSTSCARSSGSTAPA